MKLRDELSIRPIQPTMMDHPPVDYHSVKRSLLAEFSKALNAAEETRSEKPMQQFLERNPVVLVSILSAHRVWVFPRQTLGNVLGGGWQPDFLVCDWTSNGPEWTIVELESPTARAINRGGISHKCREAQQQISDYRRHLSKNWKDLELNGLIGTDQQARSWIIIGHREDYSTRDRARLVDLRNDDIEVASYDRLYGQLSEMVKFRTSRSKLPTALADWKKRNIKS
jgi:hypothetical protein